MVMPQQEDHRRVPVFSCLYPTVVLCDRDNRGDRLVVVVVVVVVVVIVVVVVVVVLVVLGDRYL